jgi:t-SNARE complex subunit (syntaxin)
MGQAEEEATDPRKGRSLGFKVHTGVVIVIIVIVVVVVVGK